MQLFKRATSNIPKAFSLQASTGPPLDDDGLWSTFKLEVGNGPGQGQNFLVVVSTSFYTTLLPGTQSCRSNESSDVIPADCTRMRGIGLYNGNTSDGYDGTRSMATAKQLGIEYILRGGYFSVTELYGQRYNVRGTDWDDELYMDTSHNSSIPVPILVIDSVSYYIASLGLGVGKHLSTVKGAPVVNSAVSAMAQSGAIPSESWGYTAGANYGMSSFLLLHILFKAMLRPR
jgi:hypothetical protein